VTARFVLGAGFVLVLCVGMYLLLEVRSRPTAIASSSSPAPSPPPEPEPELEPEPVRPTDKSAAPSDPARDLDLSHVVAAIDVTVPDVQFDQRLDAQLLEANKAYDRGDFDESRAIAQKILAKYPNNVRMLRILTSVACIDQDAPEAQKHYNRLPVQDRQAMKTRCARYSIAFSDKEPAPK
jgi:hypothetical protein